MSAVTMNTRPYNYRALVQVMQVHISKLIALMERHYGARLKVEVKHTEGRGGHHTAIYDKANPQNKRPVSHRLIFGSKGLKRDWEEGFREYASLRWILKGQTLTEGHGIYQLVMHEFAHAIQTRWGIRTAGSVHNDSFVQCYLFLLKEMPYDESMKTLYERAVVSTSPTKPALPPTAPHVVMVPVAKTPARVTQRSLMEMMA